MKNQAKVIQIIGEFPRILWRIKDILKSQENVDYILEASNYSQPVSLLNIVVPDILMLSIKLSGKDCIDLISTAMQNDSALALGIITSSHAAYYMSLCSTLGSQYRIDKSLSLESMAAGVSLQQLN